MVNNSRAAAFDVYDFLQKFFVLFPHLAKSVPLVVFLSASFLIMQLETN
jgi:hypothetical protein